MRRAALAPAVLGGALTMAFGMLALGCSSGVTPAAPRAFNRPDRVAFVCFDMTSSTDPRPAPLSECRTLSDGSYPENRRLHALVTQVARGEVAAVDLAARTILDSDRRIPGFTFVPVDEVPTDIVAPAETPACAWVASAGGRSLTAIALERFRPEHGDEVANSELVLHLPSRPSRLALAPDERTIWISFPDLGAVGRVAIDPERCTAGAVDLVTLAPDVPAGVMADPQTDLTWLCAPDDFLLSQPATFSPREHVPDDPVPAPSEMTIDVERGELYVADANLPLVHRVSLATGTLLSSLSVGAPVRDLALTPGLPDTYDLPSVTPLTTQSRFLYAIDDRDGTVMVVDVTDPGAPGFGAVLPVDVEGSARPDRIPFPVAARSIEIVLHGFDRDALDPRVGSLETIDRYDGLCDFTTTPAVTPSPSNLRGAFAMVAMADGTVRIVDLYDLGASCRGRAFGEGTPADSARCENPSVANDTFVYIRRHRPRSGSFLQRAVTLSSPPTFLVSGAQLAADASGSGGPTPRLEEITCPGGLSGVFPTTLEDPTRARVCTITDPFSAFAESWLVAWQGALSGAASTTGNFDDVDASTVALDARVDFCERGVLGADSAALVPAGEPEHQPLGAAAFGDMVAITTRISDDLLRTDERCRNVVGIDNFGQTTQPILVPIRSALSRPDGLIDPYVGRLVLDATAPLLDPDTGVLPSETAAQFGLTLADARACLGDQLVTFDVRARASYVVTGARTGHLHRVVRDDTSGICVLDPTLPRTDVGRAYHDVPYTNPRIAFLLTLPGGVRAVAGTELRINVTGTPSPAGLDLGALAGGGRALALPSEVVWSEIVSHAFVIDPERRGLVELELAPLRVLSNTRYE